MAHTRKLVLAAAVLAVLPSTAFADGSRVDEIVIVSGAIKDPQNAQYAQAPVDKNVPALPVVYEEKK